MKKFLSLVLAATIICGAMVFTSCSKKDDNKVADQIIGKWLNVESAGLKLTSDILSVSTFVKEGSGYKCYYSISMAEYDVWFYKKQANVTVDGDKIMVTLNVDDVTTVEEMTDITVDGDDLYYNGKTTLYINGEEIASYGPCQEHYVKVNEDFSQIIIGRWEGTITSDEPGYEPKPFCKKYLADGTNIDYKLIDGEWVEVETEYAEYFVDGNLLCTRWQYPGHEEERENSVFASFANDTLIVKEVVLRNGNLYTETSTLTKVSE